VEQALSAGADLSAHLVHEHNAIDQFTLLILACPNRHKDAVDLLLSQGDEVQVNKGSAAAPPSTGRRHTWRRCETTHSVWRS
jgi:hypothetical protein